MAAVIVAGCASPKALIKPEKAAPARVDVRELRAELPGGSAAEVRRRLGAPEWVTTVGEREVWEYRDLRDRVTKRPVALLEVDLVERRVTAVNFVY